MTKDIGILTGEVLVFGGVYSNLQALEAVQAFAKTRDIKPGNVVCTGDIVGYCADPTPCIELVRDWGCHAIAGNVEMNIRDGLEDCGCNFDDNSRCDIFSRIWYPYALKHSSEAAVAWMRGLSSYLAFGIGHEGHEGDTKDTKRGVVLHGNYEATSEFVWRSSDWDDVKAPAFKRSAEVYPEPVEWAKTGADIILAGHSGLPFAHEQDGKLWLNSGALGMPANDGTARVWCATLRAAKTGVDYAFHALDYDNDEARRRMLAQPLPKSYALTLANGLWDNTEIMPPTEDAWTGVPLSPEQLRADATGAAPKPVLPKGEKTKHMKDEKTYFDPKDLKRFGKISEYQPEMGKQFFEWYENVTYGDTALTQREKALIALAVSHAIRCPYCVDAFTTNSLESGADEEQMMEAVHVAAAIQAGSSLVSSVQMIKQAEKLGM